MVKVDVNIKELSQFMTPWHFWGESLMPFGHKSTLAVPKYISPKFGNF